MFNKKQRRIEELELQLRAARIDRSQTEVMANSEREIRESLHARQVKRRTIMLEAGYLDVDLIDSMQQGAAEMRSGEIVRKQVVLHLNLSRDEALALSRGVRV